jgi:hypothetical protein
MGLLLEHGEGVVLLSVPFEQVLRLVPFAHSLVVEPQPMPSELQTCTPVAPSHAAAPGVHVTQAFR